MIFYSSYETLVLNMTLKCCASCCNRLRGSTIRPRSFPAPILRSCLHHFIPLRNQSSKSEDRIHETMTQVRQRAWYLESSTASSSSPSSSETNISFSLHSDHRQPIFSTFDPSRTTLEPSTQRIIPPLPDNTPEFLRPLHSYLISDEAALVLESSSVVFLHTPSAPISSVGPGDLIKGGMEAGARWEWVVVVQVRGIGKGVVGRAERAVRLWVSKPFSNRSFFHKIRCEEPLMKESIFFSYTSIHCRHM